MSHSVSCENIRIDGKELSVYYTKSELTDCDKPCRFCGSRPAYTPEVNVVEIFVGGYKEVAKSDPHFNKAEKILRQKELHGKPFCTRDLCEKKHMHELLGSEEVFDMIAKGEYVPD